MATMSPLRRRMIEDMTIRNRSPSTQQSYIYAIVKFSRHFGCSPDQLNLEQVRAYLRSAPGRTSTKSPAHCGSFTVSRWGRRSRSSGLSAARSQTSFHSSSIEPSCIPR